MALSQYQSVKKNKSTAEIQLAIEMLQEEGKSVTVKEVMYITSLSYPTVWKHPLMQNFINHHKVEINSIKAEKTKTIPKNIHEIIEQIIREGSRLSIENVSNKAKISKWKARKLIRLYREEYARHELRKNSLNSGTKEVTTIPANSLANYIRLILDNYFLKSQKLSEVREDMLAEHADFDNALFERAISKLQQDGVLKRHAALPGYFMQDLPHEEPRVAPSEFPSIFDIGSSWIVGRPHEEFPVEEDSEPPVAPTKAKSFLILDQFMNVHDYEGDDTIDDTLKSLLDANRDIRLTVYRPVKTAHLIPEIQSL